MAVKSLIFCAVALLVQSAYSACLGGFASRYGLAGAGCGCNGFGSPALAYDGFVGPALGYERAAGFGCGCGGVASTGGGLPCASASPVAPVGVSVLSENVYEGVLAAGGNLPFLGTVAVEGVLPTAGASAVSYGCGNNLCAIVEEDGVIATGIAPHGPGLYGAYGAYGPAAAGYSGLGCGCGGVGYGLAGCGCGALY